MHCSAESNRQSCVKSGQRCLMTWQVRSCHWVAYSIVLCTWNELMRGVACHYICPLHCPLHYPLQDKTVTIDTCATLTIGDDTDVISGCPQAVTPPLQPDGPILVYYKSLGSLPASTDTCPPGQCNVLADARRRASAMTNAVA